MATTRYHFTIDVTHEGAPADPFYLAHAIDKHLMQLPDVILSKSVQLQDPIDLTPWERVWIKGVVRSALSSLIGADGRRQMEGREPLHTVRIGTLQALLSKMTYQHEGT